MLLHSGLAQAPHLQCEVGILLAGRSGVGKSTASTRLPPPWHALADDVTLVVRDGGGVYWAHPWPTWSWFFSKEDYRPGGGVWDVQQAVPLRALFVLEQGKEDLVGPMGPGHAVALLTELARQTSRHFLRDMPLDEIAAFNLQRFENLCALARAVPAYLLHVSLDGPFWTEIERVMCEGEGQRDQAVFQA
jgi:SynChlorMet cassette protein ScmC